MIFAIIIIVLFVAFDQAVKFLTVSSLALYESASFIPGLVEFYRLHNYGAAWSSFSGMRWVLIGITTAIIVVLAVLLVRRIVRHPVGVVSLSLIIAGGIGNLIDRIRIGYVVDMFNFQFMSFPVFNVADICVVCGGILAAIYYLFLFDKYDKGAK